MFSTWAARSKLKSKELESIRVSGLDKFPPCLARSADQSDVGCVVFLGLGEFFFP